MTAPRNKTSQTRPPRKAAAKPVKPEAVEPEVFDLDDAVAQARESIEVPDFAFKYKGETYTLSPDMNASAIMRLFEIQDSETAGPQDMIAVVNVLLGDQAEKFNASNPSVLAVTKFLEAYGNHVGASVPKSSD